MLAVVRLVVSYLLARIAWLLQGMDERNSRGTKDVETYVHTGFWKPKVNCRLQEALLGWIELNIFRCEHKFLNLSSVIFTQPVLIHFLLLFLDHRRLGCILAKYFFQKMNQ